jgi:hypothetical protein
MGKKKKKKKINKKKGSLHARPCTVRTCTSVAFQPIAFQPTVWLECQSGPPTTRNSHSPPFFFFLENHQNHQLAAQLSYATMLRVACSVGLRPAARRAFAALSAAKPSAARPTPRRVSHSGPRASARVSRSLFECFEGLSFLFLLLLLLAWSCGIGLACIYWY